MKASHILIFMVVGQVNRFLKIIFNRILVDLVRGDDCTI